MTQKIILDLENAIHQQLGAYSVRAEEIGRKRQELFAGLNDYISQKGAELGSIKPTNRYISDIEDRLAEIKEHIESAKSEHDPQIRQISDLCQQAFTEYKNNVDAAFADALKRSSDAISARAAGIASIYGDGSCTIESMKSELSQLDSMKQQMDQLGQQSKIVQAYNQRRDELAQSISKYESKKNEITSSITLPIAVEKWARGVTLKYPYSLGIGAIFENALKSVIRQSGRRMPSIQEHNGFHSVMIGNCDIALELDEEIAKPEYAILRSAGINFRYFIVPTSSSQLKEDIERAGRKYTMQDAAKSLGVAYGNLASIVYKENKGILEQHSVKEGNRRLLTQEGYDEVQRVLAGRKMRHKKISMKEAAERLGVGYSAFRNLVYVNRRELLDYSTSEGRARHFTEDNFRKLEQHLASIRQTDDKIAKFQGMGQGYKKK